MEVYDSIVIGAGPGGMTAALYLCRFGLKTALLEKLTPGGQMLNTFEVCNYPGFPVCTPGWNLADTFFDHLKEYPLEHLPRAATAIRSEGNLHHVVTNEGEMAARSVIIASGARARKLGVEGEKLLTGSGVSYCAMCDGMFFKNKTVAVVGGGNAAVEEAMHLSRIVSKLYLVHRRDRFKADSCHIAKLREHSDKIEMVLGHTVTALHGIDKLTGITVEPAGGGEPRRLDVDGLFIFVGIEPINDFFGSGLHTDKHGFLTTDAEMRTNIPGIFGAGDIRSKHCRQVVTAVGDGATAAFSAFSYLEMAKA